jgi:hypothetical protein
MLFANQGEITTALQGFGVAACNGWYMDGADDQHTDGRWVTVQRYDPFGFSV